MGNTNEKIAANVGSTNATNCVSKMDDFTLLKMCAEFGKAAILARQKFIGLLPEVNKRELYKKRGCNSIYEFAAKLAGVSNDLVDQAIRLEKKLRNKPALHTAFVEGLASMSKLERICSVATPENDEEWLNDVKVLPRKALDVRVRDFKNLSNAIEEGSVNVVLEGSVDGNGKIQNGLLELLSGLKVLPGQNIPSLKRELSNEVVEELNRLDDQGQDINKILLELLEYRKQKIAEEKQEISACAEVTNSRYVNAATKRVLAEEYGTKCSMPGCKKLAAAVHHTLPFAVAHVHDPAFMVPLCREHHQIAHLVNLKFAEKLRKK